MKKSVCLFLIILFLLSTIALPTRAAISCNYSKPILPNYSYKIPGLDTTFVPQGLCKSSFRGITYRLITAYDYNYSKNSRIYIMDSNGKHLKTVYLSNSAGKHLGGITDYLGDIWIASTNVLYKISKYTLFEIAKNNATIEAEIVSTKDMSSIPGSFSFCTSYNDILWIGTFNEKKPSKAYGYKYGSQCGSNYRLKQVATMDIPSLCQGMAFLNNSTVFFSISYGASNSVIAKYTYSISTKNGITKYSVKKLNSSITAPSRSQEIYITSSNNIYVLFESGSKVFKYKRGIKENRVVLIDL